MDLLPLYFARLLVWQDQQLKRILLSPVNPLCSRQRKNSDERNTFPARWTKKTGVFQFGGFCCSISLFSLLIAETRWEIKKRHGQSILLFYCFWIMRMRDENWLAQIWKIQLDIAAAAIPQCHHWKNMAEFTKNRLHHIADIFSSQTFRFGLTSDPFIKEHNWIL